MKIHEFQAKKLLASYKIPVPRGEVAFTPQDARSIAAQFPGKSLVIKAQIHAGGRGKGGGIKVADTPEQAEARAKEMLGMTLVTPQTGPEGKIVKRVLVEEAITSARELYLGLVVDRGTARPVVIASEAGGMEIEEIAGKSPEKILRESIDPLLGMSTFQARRLAYRLNFPGHLIREAIALFRNLYRLFVDKDCSLVEINPLVITTDEKLLALDAKLDFDDNALFRHEDIRSLRDLDEEDPLEVEASKYGLNYIKLDGNVGCIVNGAGLAMATMDIIKLSGAEPANFLDVGGGASAEMVENAFRILLSDPKVEAVLINIFGGILRCDVFAQGVVQAVSKVQVSLPVIVRMEGTNVEQGKQILQSSGLNFIVASGMQDAAEKVRAVLRG